MLCVFQVCIDGDTHLAMQNVYIVVIKKGGIDTFIHHQKRDNHLIHVHEFVAILRLESLDDHGV